ncbi:hypothetical protein KDA00_05500, partial [Candidatus Saccharibacteria bacterium]|nr:hypothetical protein [Candidatus Saccharibacteria bacterium]
MDNFRKSKSKKRSNLAVDGFTSSGSRTRSRSGVSKPTPRAKEPIGRVGNFGSTDGFRPNKQSQIRSQMGSTKSRNPNRNMDGSIDLRMPDEGSK